MSQKSALNQEFRSESKSWPIQTSGESCRLRIHSLPILALASLTLWVGGRARAEVIKFEGAYAIEESNRLAGYSLQRVEESKDGKLLTIRSYFHRGLRESEVTEIQMTKAVSTKDFRPILVQKRTILDGVDQTSEVDFRKGSTPNINLYDTVTCKFSDSQLCDGKILSATPLNHVGGESAFISAFLFYKYQGSVLKMGGAQKRHYLAYSETDEREEDGWYRVTGSQSITSKGHTVEVRKIVDFFEGESVENFVLSSGDAVGSQSGETRNYLIRPEILAERLNKKARWVVSPQEKTRMMDFFRLEDSQSQANSKSDDSNLSNPFPVRSSEVLRVLDLLDARDLVRKSEPKKTPTER